jgi:hypothetical protein
MLPIFLQIVNGVSMNKSEIFERVTGVEPVSSPWQGDIGPINYTRTSFGYTGLSVNYFSF